MSINWQEEYEKQKGTGTLTDCDVSDVVVALRKIAEILDDILFNQIETMLNKQ